MAIQYYDDAIVQKLQKQIPENSNLRILTQNDIKRLFETKADDNNDANFKLPFIALSRSNDIELLSTIKQPRSFNGLHLINTTTESVDATMLFNVIPISVKYQLDVYTKRQEECEEYIRSFLFKLINNPTITIDIPYNSEGFKKAGSDIYLQHIANIRVAPTISNTSDIPQHLFAGQFYRYTISFELQDAFLFSVPYKRNQRFDGVIFEVADNLTTDKYEIEADESFFKYNN